MKESEIILIFGRRGSGKTTLCKDIIKKKERLIIYDPLKEYENCGLWANNWETFRRNIIKFQHNPYLRLVYTPAFDEDANKYFNIVCRVVYGLKNIMFVIEEIGRFVTAVSFSKSFDGLVRLSRHAGIDIIGITQRASDVPRLIRSQATKIITFQQIEPRDIDYLGELIDEENIEKIKKLETGEYLEYDVKKGIKEIKKIKL